MEHLEHLTVNEVAELKNVSVRSVQKSISNGKLSCTIEFNDKNRPKYMIPISSLPTDLQAKYYGKQRQDAGLEPAKTEKKQSSNTVKKAFEDFTEAERAEIAMWSGIIQDWQSC